MADCMTFPEDWHDFLKDYSFNDSEHAYTNGSELIPVFRVEQLIDHLMKERAQAVPCEDCEYSYVVGFVNERLYCEKHPELGPVKGDWFCADCWKA